MNFAILGKTPALSVAELAAVLTRDGFKHQFKRVTAKAAIFEAEKFTADGAFWDQFGGLVKAGSIIRNFPAGVEAKELVDVLAEFLATKAPSGKIHFGVSLYALDSSQKPGPLFARLATQLKAELLARGRGARHVVSREPELSAVTVKRNRLLTHGSEFCVFCDRENIFLGATEWVQDYREFAEREFSRPEIDAKAGMLPVKLARAMVNLSDAPKNKKILDPFCGSGTVLTEALSLGYTKVAGSDVAEEAVEQTRKNTAWLIERNKLKAETEILIAPAETLSSYFKPGSIAAIVTEPYLGPPLRGRETAEELEEVETELLAIYKDAFREFAKVLAADGRVVFAFPILPGGRELAAILLPEIQQLGFAVALLVPERWSHAPGLTFSQAGGIIYARPGQKVRREILCFKRA